MWLAGKNGRRWRGFGPRQAELRRNLLADIALGLSHGVAVGVVGALLPGIARRGGLDPLGLAALAAAPFLANVLGVLAGRVGPRTAAELALLRASGSGLLLLLPFVPQPVYVLVALAFWVSISFSLPLQLRVWGIIYPARERARLIGVVRTLQAAAAAAVALAGGALADRVGGPPVVALAGAIGAALVMGYARVRASASEAPRPYSALESLRRLYGNPRVRPLLVAQGLWGGGLIAAAPLYPLVQVDRLGLSLSEIGLLGILAAAATTLSYVAWGVVADRRGAVLVLTCGAAVGAAQPLLYALAPDRSVLWLAALAAGLSSAAMDTGITAALTERAPLAERASVMAGWGAVTGARGVIAPFLGAGLVQAGLLTPAAALLGCVLVSLLGLGLYVRTLRADVRPVLAPAPAPAPGGSAQRRAESPPPAAEALRPGSASAAMRGA